MESHWDGMPMALGWLPYGFGMPSGWHWGCIGVPSGLNPSQSNHSPSTVHLLSPEVIGYYFNGGPEGES